MLSLETLSTVVCSNVDNFFTNSEGYKFSMTNNEVVWEKILGETVSHVSETMGLHMSVKQWAYMPVSPNIFSTYGLG